MRRESIRPAPVRAQRGATVMTSNRHANDRREFLKNLRQSRRFLDRPVPQDIVDDLIAAARTVRDGEDPASWQFLVIDDLATKQALSGVGAFTEFPVSYTHLRAHETDSYLV